MKVPNNRTTVIVISGVIFLLVVLVLLLAALPIQDNTYYDTVPHQNLATQIGELRRDVHTLQTQIARTENAQ